MTKWTELKMTILYAAYNKLSSTSRINIDWKWRNRRIYCIKKETKKDQGNYLHLVKYPVSEKYKMTQIESLEIEGSIQEEWITIINIFGTQIWNL
jgi:hypothetical protein